MLVCKEFPILEPFLIGDSDSPIGLLDLICCRIEV